MNINFIRNKISNITNTLDDQFKYFSILVPIIEIKGTPHLIFEVRSHGLRRQPGEICFPGGKKEPNESFKETAIRETIEELNISDENIDIIGKLPSVSTHYNNYIYPFIAIIKNVKVKDISFNKSEVDKIFTVPLSFFMENLPLEHYIETQPNPLDGFPYHLLPNGEDYPWFKGKYPVYFYQYKSYVIWGLTAKTIKALIDILEN